MSLIDHLNEVKRQRQILDDWQAYEYDLCQYWKAEFNRKDPETFFAKYTEKYTNNLRVSGSRLRRASSEGELVEITHTKLAVDVQAVATPVNSLTPTDDKLRIRANLARLDIFERIGVWAQVQVHKMTILDIQQPTNADTPSQLSAKFIVPEYRPVVLLTIAERKHAAAYRLAI